MIKQPNSAYFLEIKYYYLHWCCSSISNPRGRQISDYCVARIVFKWKWVGSHPVSLIFQLIKYICRVLCTEWRGRICWFTSIQVLLMGLLYKEGTESVCRWFPHTTKLFVTLGNRMGLVYNAILCMFDRKSFFAPVENPQQIVDIGIRTGN
jgi:hypothetical protein